MTTFPSPIWRQMMIVEFLTVRFDEEERLSADARGYDTGSRHEGQPDPWSAWVARCNTHTTLREVRARLRILREHQPERATGEPYGTYGEDWLRCRTCRADSVTGGVLSAQSCWFPCPTIRLLAAPYDWHADYSKDWAPDE